MEIAVENQQKKLRLKSTQISKIAKTILHREGVKKANLSIVFVTSQKIRNLNKEYLGRSYATDVLAFDLSERGSKTLQGDIIISTDAVIKNARLFNIDQSEELSLYVIHGILHLLGFDDHRQIDIKKMRKKEEEMLKYLGTQARRTLG